MVRPHALVGQRRTLKVRYSLWTTATYWRFKLIKVVPCGSKNQIAHPLLNVLAVAFYSYERSTATATHVHQYMKTAEDP